MEITRQFNLDIKASEVMEIIDNYLDDIVRDRTKGCLTFEDLTPTEKSDLYTMVVGFLREQTKRVGGE